MHLSGFLFVLYCVLVSIANVGVTWSHKRANHQGGSGFLLLCLTGKCPQDHACAKLSTDSILQWVCVSVCGGG